MRAIGFDEITFGRVARLRGPANEGDAFSVERPLRRGVGVDAGRKKFYGFLLHVVNRNEAVITAGGREGEKLSIGRPLLLAVLASDDDLQGLCACVERRKPELAITRVGDSACC